MTTVLALDGGQSGIRTRLTREGAPEEREFPGILTDRPVLPQLAGIIADAADGRGIDVVGLGVSGLGPGDSAADLLAQTPSVARVLVAHDSITSYLGALGVHDGAVVAAGTGAVTLAVGPAEVRRVDGWGYLLGDLGAGFWIGREGLAAVLRAFDGRGPATALTDDVLAEFGDLSRVYLDIQADPGRVARVAAWARRVSELAHVDEVCADISRAAGRHLAESVAAGLRAVAAAPVASCVGNVFRNPLIQSSFDEHLAGLVPGVEILAPAGTGLDGAAQLVDVEPDSPLGRLIDAAAVEAAG